MNVFETIKAAVPMREAAEHYGLRVLPNGMACCPFHEDHHPSLKLNEDYFFCFGCGVHGDVIDFTAKLWDLPIQEAVEKLSSDFEIGMEQVPIPFPTFPEAAPNLERLCIRISGNIFDCCESGGCGMRPSHSAATRMIGLWRVCRWSQLSISFWIL